ncbi:hypothetical protein [uncultured Desulfuromonas sp.]|uniref:hypothetical protein n=1 Tax=uncultured Desulfuromonas sp. TaxID=181013 RepID=UPI002628915A|nr:hypothetical protein [uncultured Desulfuromonas sp.]
MNAKLSQHMTLLGLCAVGFYGFMAATGRLGLDVMPQFMVSAMIFMLSGRFMKKAAREVRDEDDEKKPKVAEEDWSFFANLVNWMGALVVVGVMAILLMKPVGLSIVDALQASIEHEQFSAHVVP